MGKSEVQPSSDTPYPRVTWRTRLYAGAFTGSLRLLLYMFTAIKWLLAPIVLLIDVLILFPIGRFTIKLKADPTFKIIQDNDLPDVVWCYFQDTCLQFSRLGFRVGGYMTSEDLMPGQTIYNMTMVNEKDQMGAGFIYLRPNKAKTADLDVTACEFTCARDGKPVDLTNNASLEPFLPMPGRLRLYLDDYGDEQLYYLMRALQNKLHCTCNRKMLEILQNRPELIVSDEFKRMVKTNLKRGYFYHNAQTNFYHLTWKGAWLSTLQTLWPTSVLYRRRLNRMAHEVFAGVGLDPEAIAWDSDPWLQEFVIDRALTTPGALMHFITPIARTNGMQIMPARIEVNLSRHEEEWRHDLINVHYEEAQDFETRQMRAHSLFSIQLEIQENRASIYQNERYLISYEDDTESEYGDWEPLPANLHQSLAFEGVAERLVNGLQIPLDDVVDFECQCLMRRGRAVWCGFWYDPQQDAESVIYIDAFTGDLVDRELNQFDNELKH